MSALWLFVCFLSQICCVFGSECSPLVHVSDGSLKGKCMTTRGGRTFHAFLGIPFAKPPIGDLRFRVGSLKINELINKN